MPAPRRGPAVRRRRDAVTTGRTYTQAELDGQAARIRSAEQRATERAVRKARVRMALTVLGVRPDRAERATTLLLTDLDRRADDLAVLRAAVVLWSELPELFSPRPLLAGHLHSPGAWAPAPITGVNRPDQSEGARPAQDAPNGGTAA